MTARREFKITARRWEHGWEVHVEDLGVTQSAADATDAEAMAADLIVEELGLKPGTYHIDLDTTEVDQ